MYDAPCSRVGHVYRGPMDPKPPAREGDFLHKVKFMSICWTHTMSE